MDKEEKTYFSVIILIHSKYHNIETEIKLSSYYKKQLKEINQWKIKLIIIRGKSVKENNFLLFIFTSFKEQHNKKKIVWIHSKFTTLLIDECENIRCYIFRKK